MPRRDQLGSSPPAAMAAESDVARAHDTASTGSDARPHPPGAAPVSAVVGQTRARERLVVVGAGMAALRLVEELVALCPERYRITMVGAEARPAYNRMLLSSLLAGDATEADIELRPPAWYTHHRIELLTGVACTA